MKGLLVKDFKLIKVQSNFLFAIIGIAVVMASINDDATFILGFLSFVMPMFALSTITYDEFDNGNAFLFTLPVSRRSYVVEKYLFSILLGAGSWTLAAAVAALFSIIKGTVPLTEALMTAVMMLPVMLMIQAIMIPFQLKFGGEKSRIAMAGAVGILFVIGFLAVGIAEMLGVDLVNILNSLPAISMSMVAAIIAAAAVVIFLVSMKSSISIMNKKEF